MALGDPVWKGLLVAAAETAARESLSCSPKWSLTEKAATDQTQRGISQHPESGWITNQVPPRSVRRRGKSRLNSGLSPNAWWSAGWRRGGPQPTEAMRRGQQGTSIRPFAQGGRDAGVWLGYWTVRMHQWANEPPGRCLAG